MVHYIYIYAGVTEIAWYRGSAKNQDITIIQTSSDLCIRRCAINSSEVHKKRKTRY